MPKTIKRSTKIKLNFSNKGKLSNLFHLLDQEVSDLLSKEINELIYSENPIPPLMPKEFTSKLPFSSRVNQLISKEISSNARSIKNKIKKAEGVQNKKKYQQELVDKYIEKTLNIKWLGNLNLDSRFVSIQENKESKDFDYWLEVKFPRKNKILVPFKTTRHIKSLISRGYLLKTNVIKICRNNTIILFFEREQVQPIENKDIIGIDIGRNKAFITSRNESESQLKVLLSQLVNKKHGSKNKASHIRKICQLIDLEIKNNIDWTSISKVALEGLKSMKYNNKWGNIHHHWSYSYIQNRINLLAEELGVQVLKVNAAYTSQMCSSCGHVHKNNRHGEKFLCIKCGFKTDADLNAAINIRNQGTNSGHVARKRSL